MEEINLNDLFKYFLKHVKLIILILALVVAAGEVYSAFFKVPKYQSSTSIAFSSDTAVTNTDVTTTKNMAGTYTEVIKSELVLEQAVKGTNFDVSAAEKSLSVSSDASSGILKVTVTTTNAGDSQTLAQHIANAFIDVASDKYKADNVFILNEAHLASSPSNINVVKDTLIYVAVGLVLGFGIVFIMFYFDKKIHNNEEVERKLAVPVLGNIRTTTAVKSKGKAELAIKNAPQAGVSEDIRTLRANIEFGFGEKDDHTVLITSSTKSEGKSFISSNLAYALALNGKKTLLIDCDLRRGRLHHIFRVDNLNGMSDLILNRDLGNLDKYIRVVEDKRLYVIPRGIIPLNPSELLASQNFIDIIKYLKRFYDYIILDGAPVLNLSDSLAISKLAGKTVLVATANYTTIDDLENAKKTLNQVDARVAGVVLNKVQVSENKYYYHE